MVMRSEMNRYEIPEARRKAVREALSSLEASTKVILTTHVNADGDGAGCEAALLSYLEHRGVEAWIVNPTPFPTQLRFMVDSHRRILDVLSQEAIDRCANADLCVILDAGERARIGRVGPLVAQLPTLIVDHHPPAGGSVKGSAFLDSTAAATGELVFDLLWSENGPWTHSVVSGLYVAIMTDTGSFRFSNVTAGVHRVVAELIQRGASPDALYREVYGRVPIRRVRLLQEALPTLDVSPDGRVAWLSVEQGMLSSLGCTGDDLEGMIDYPRELDGVEVGLLFRELEGKQVKVSFRSNGTVDVNALAREFGGGGHLRASGALVSGSLESVRDRVVPLVIVAAEEGESDLHHASVSEP
jgi:phosphoesterase RecJ-like protein